MKIIFVSLYKVFFDMTLTNHNSNCEVFQSQPTQFSVGQCRFKRYHFFIQSKKSIPKRNLLDYYFKILFIVNVY